jgi:hypothetical protein
LLLAEHADATAVPENIAAQLTARSGTGDLMLRFPDWQSRGLRL